MKTTLIVYIIIALLSGLYSLRMQKKYHPNHVGMVRMIIVFFLNSVFWPITIAWAITTKQLF